LEVSHTKLGGVLLVIYTFGKVHPTHITVDAVWFTQAMEAEVKERERQERQFTQTPYVPPAQRRPEGSAETT